MALVNLFYVFNGLKSELILNSRLALCLGELNAERQKFLECMLLLLMDSVSLTGNYNLREEYF